MMPKDQYKEYKKNLKIKQLQEQNKLLKKQIENMEKILNTRRNDRDVLFEAFELACSLIPKEHIPSGAWARVGAYLLNRVKERNSNMEGSK